MLFTTPLFAFIFAPLAIALNLVLPARARPWLILLASVVFYAWGEPRFVAVVLVAALADHGLALAIARRPREERQGLLAFGVALNLGLLAWCKYVSFFVASFEAVLGPIGLPVPQILIPLGISFIVFEKITYLVDVARGTSPPAARLRDYLVFVFLFPKLLAGPILKFHEMRDQIEGHRVGLDDIEAGALRFMVGLFKKVIIADGVAEIADRAFGAPGAELGFGDAWLGALAFAVQIYFDFSAYSDMAIGLARALGFRLKENFDQPYLAVGFTDFWRRWHISLSTWIRDYLYVPLGGNRGSIPRTYVNLWICFLTSGLWHGASWTFVLWGAFHGLFVSADRLGLARVWPRIPRAAGVAATFLLVVLGWVLFRATSFGQAAAFYAAMADPSRPMTLAPPTADAAFSLTLGLALAFLPLAFVRSVADRLLGSRSLAFAQGAMLVLCLWPLGRMLTSTFTPFIYFRF